MDASTILRQMISKQVKSPGYWNIILSGNYPKGSGQQVKSSYYNKWIVLHFYNGEWRKEYKNLKSSYTWDEILSFINDDDILIVVETGVITEYETIRKYKVFSLWTKNKLFEGSIKDENWPT